MMVANKRKIQRLKPGMEDTLTRPAGHLQELHFGGLMVGCRASSRGPLDRRSFAVGFCLLARRCLAWRPAPLTCLCRRRPRRQPEHPFHVVGEIGEADFNFRPGQPGGADDKLHRTLFPGEDVLDPGADL